MAIMLLFKVSFFQSYNLDELFLVRDEDSNLYLKRLEELSWRDFIIDALDLLFSVNAAKHSILVVIFLFLMMKFFFSQVPLLFFLEDLLDFLVSGEFSKTPFTVPVIGLWNGSGV